MHLWWEQLFFLRNPVHFFYSSITNKPTLLVLFSLSGLEVSLALMQNCACTIQKQEEPIRKNDLQTRAPSPPFIVWCRLWSLERKSTSYTFWSLLQLSHVTPLLPVLTPAAVVAKVLTRYSEHCQDHVGTVLFLWLIEKKKKEVLSWLWYPERLEAGLSLWITSVSAGLWCGLTASDNFYKLEEHTLPPPCFCTGSHGRDTDSTEKCVCSAPTLSPFQVEKNSYLRLLSAWASFNHKCNINTS